MPETRSHMLRQIDRDVLDDAKAKARAEGRSFDDVLRILIAMYGSGYLAVPTRDAWESEGSAAVP